MPKKKTGSISKGTFPIVGVGASAGGLEALRSLLQHLPATTGMAFVLVQHLDPEHESLLAKLLSPATRMPVTEVTEGVAVEPDHIYVIPPDKALEIRDGVLHMLARRRQEPKHLPIDVFFHSLAENEGHRAIGVILSGVATDGTLGLAAIKAAGGITFAQDPQSAKYDGMPRSAIAAGCVDFVLPPAGIARELKRISLHPYLGRPDHPAAETRAEQRGEELLRIFALLRNATDVDFTNYKRSTINRRIARRMVLHKVSDLRQYLKYLHDNRSEVSALCEDLLIHVTSFFREPDAFRALKGTVLPRIVRSKAPGEPLRVWVAGCSTGEEVYSIAITILEYLQRYGESVPMQIFGTDVSETVLETARAGIYSQSAMSVVSAARKREFFVRVDGGYQIVKRVREMCVFARQDLTKDPPYSRLDLVSCRNVLIYMEPVLQKKVMAALHYALKPHGFLMLGKSESTSGFSELFRLVARKHKIYAKKSSSMGPDVAPARSTHAPAKTFGPATTVRFDPQKEADRIVMNQYAPAGLVASGDLQILHFRGNVTPYLALPPGKASLSLLRLVRPEFAAELRTAIQRAEKEDISIRKQGLLFKRNGHVNEVDLEVVPFKGSADERFFLVLFHENPVPDSESTKQASQAESPGNDGLEAARLQRELQAIKGQMQSVIDEHEATNEELKSATEEALSSNEELQSSNEELETAQEELQSSNEELVTINEQLQNRNRELSQLSDDWSNLLSGLNIPVVMLGKDLRIRRVTQPAEKLLGLIPADIGRHISNIRSSFKVPSLANFAAEVTEQVGQKEVEIQDHNGRWYSMRMRPYWTSDNRIDGVLMIYIDIHDLKTMQAALEEKKGFSEAVMESTGALVMVTDLDGRVVSFNRACQIISGYKLEEIAGKVIWESALIPRDEAKSVQTIYRRLAAGLDSIQHENHWIVRSGPRRLISWNSAPMPHPSRHPNHLVRIGTDITERREMEAALRQSQTQLQTLAAGLVAAQEEERARVARELHDDIGQKLAMLNLEAESVLRKGARTDELRNELARLSHRLRGIMQDVEQTSYRLHPSALEHLGLSVALKSYCADFGKQNDITIRFSQRNLPRLIPPDLGLTLYRILQEALRNVSKHSGSRQAAVSVAGENGVITLRIKDSGRGFDPSSTKKRGLGLISMAERVRGAGGTLAVKSTPGAGSSIEARIPIPRGSTGGRSSHVSRRHAPASGKTNRT
jgi:two-component system, chemotaxis family, CheB/CheR fusion protein